MASLPAELVAGETVQVALGVDVPGTQASGRVLSCPSPVAPAECEQGPRSGLVIDPPTFSGESGVYTFSVHAPLDAYSCTSDDTAYLLAVVDLEATSSGADLGRFSSPLTGTTVRARREPRLVLEPATLTFNALAGQATSSQTLFPGVYCTSGTPPRPTGLSFVTDVPWLSIEDTPFPFDDAVLVTADTAGLDPRQSPYHAVVRAMAAGVASAPVEVPVTVNVVELTARWTPPPPADVAAGSDVPLSLEVSGDVVHIDGALGACEVWDHDGCVIYDLQFTSPGERFSGPPGTFTFVAHRPYDCRPDTDVEIRPYVTVTDRTGSTVGPFALPRALFTATASSVEEIEVGPTSVLEGLVVDLPDGAGTVPHDITLRSSCRTSSAVYARWTATASAPWLSLSRNQGGLPTHQYGMPYVVTLEADPTLLPPTTGPHTAEVTFTAEGTRNGSVSVPVTVRRRPEVQVRWVDPVPGIVPLPLYTGDQLALQLDVTGAASSVAGAVEVCPERLLPGILVGCPSGGSLGFDDDGLFQGPPGSFTLMGTVPGTCLGYGRRTLRTRLTITAAPGETWQPVLAPSQLIDRVRTGDPLTVQPQALTIRGLVGQHPLVGTLRVQVPSVGCFNAMPWSVRTTASWLTATPQAGTIASSGGPGRAVWMVVDPTAFDPAESPHDAEAIFEFPTGEIPTITVPVQVGLVAVPPP